MNLHLAAVLVTLLALAPLLRRTTVLIGVVPQLGLVLVGVATMHTEGRATLGAFIAACAGLLALSYAHALGSVQAASRPTSRPVLGARPAPAPFIRGCVGVTTVGTALHFLLGGVPLLQSNVEIARFDFDSGLFGFPGRMFLVGAIVSVLLACTDANARGVRWRDDGPARLALTVLVVSRMLAGFKSGLLEVAFVLLIVLVVAGRRTTSPLATARRHGLLALPVTAYMLFVLSRYGTFNASGQTVEAALWERLTVIGAEPAVAALDGLAERPPGLLTWNDATYFLLKYSGQDTTGRTTFEHVVSATILGQDPSWDVFAPPVTVGGLAELSATLGVPVAVVLCGLAGWWVARAERRPSTSVLTLVLRVTAVYTLTTFLLKGSLAYLAVNTTLVLVAVAVIGWAWMQAEAAFSARGPQPARTGAPRVGAGR